MPTEQLGSLSSPQHHCGGHHLVPFLSGLGLCSATLGLRHGILVPGFHSIALQWFVYIVMLLGLHSFSCCNSIPFCS